MKEELSEALVNRFIESCSHDLKSPLTSVQGLVNLAQHYTDNAEVLKCLSMIASCTSKMQHILHTLEEVMVQSQHELNLTETNAQDMINEVLQEHEAEIENKAILITSTVTQESPWITDRHCSYLILKNLVDNSIKFNDPAKTNHTVDISISINETHANVSVTDNGIGIDSGKVNKIFDPFYRASMQSNGNGLGLFVVKAMAHKLNGMCSVRTEEKRGSSFRVEIPNALKRAALALAFFLVSCAFLHGQSLRLSPGVEKTVAGLQYGIALDFRSKGEWVFGSFYQCGIAKETEAWQSKDQFYGLLLAAPLAKAPNMVFRASVRTGLVNDNYFVVAPGMETEFRLMKTIRLSFNTAIRMRQLAAGVKVSIPVF